MANRGKYYNQSFGGEKHVHQRLTRYLSKNILIPQSVIFDIGTKAIRVLMGPKNLSKKSWTQQDFFSDAILTHLGAEIGLDDTLKQNSSALEKIIVFVNHYYQKLKSIVSDNDFFVFGTAAFRWMKNRSDIIAYFNRKTGLNLRVLSQEGEARFALCGVMATYNMRRTGPLLDRKSEDIIMLLDQGGGSMEISYATMAFENTGLYSFDDLGTIALRRRFFETAPTGELIDPNHNQSRIAAQHSRIQGHIQIRVQDWDGYPEIKGKNIHAYALGSAASSLFSSSNFEAHNRVVRKEEIVRRIKKNNQSMHSDDRYVSALYQDGIENTTKVDTLLLLYGLPVYVGIMEKFGLEELRMCGYGLRYGILVGINTYKIPIEEI